MAVVLQLIESGRLQVAQANSTVSSCDAFAPTAVSGRANPYAESMAAVSSQELWEDANEQNDFWAHIGHSSSAGAPAAADYAFDSCGNLDIACADRLDKDMVPVAVDRKEWTRNSREQSNSGTSRSSGSFGGQLSYGSKTPASYSAGWGGSYDPGRSQPPAVSPVGLAPAGAGRADYSHPIQLRSMAPSPVVQAPPTHGYASFAGAFEYLDRSADAANRTIVSNVRQFPALSPAQPPGAAAGVRPTLTGVVEAARPATRQRQKGVTAAQQSAAVLVAAASKTAAVVVKAPSRTALLRDTEAAVDPDGHQCDSDVSVHLTPPDSDDSSSESLLSSSSSDNDDSSSDSGSEVKRPPARPMLRAGATAGRASAASGRASTTASGACATPAHAGGGSSTDDSDSTDDDNDAPGPETQAEEQRHLETALRQLGGTLVPLKPAPCAVPVPAAAGREAAATARRSPPAAGKQLPVPAPSQAGMPIDGANGDEDADDENETTGAGSCSSSRRRVSAAMSCSPAVEGPAVVSAHTAAVSRKRARSGSSDAGKVDARVLQRPRRADGATSGPSQSPAAPVTPPRRAPLVTISTQCSPHLLPAPVAAHATVAACALTMCDAGCSPIALGLASLRRLASSATSPAPPAGSLSQGGRAATPSAPSAGLTSLPSPSRAAAALPPSPAHEASGSLADVDAQQGGAVEAGRATSLPQAASDELGGLGAGGMGSRVGVSSSQGDCCGTQGGAPAVPGNAAESDSRYLGGASSAGATQEPPHSPSPPPPPPPPRPLTAFERIELLKARLQLATAGLTAASAEGHRSAASRQAAAGMDPGRAGPAAGGSRGGATSRSLSDSRHDADSWNVRTGAAYGLGGGSPVLGSQLAAFDSQFDEEAHGDEYDDEEGSRGEGRGMGGLDARTRQLGQEAECDDVEEADAAAHMHAGVSSGGNNSSLSGSGAQRTPLQASRASAREAPVPPSQAEVDVDGIGDVYSQELYGSASQAPAPHRLPAQRPAKLPMTVGPRAASAAVSVQQGSVYNGAAAGLGGTGSARQSQPNPCDVRRSSIGRTLAPQQQAPPPRQTPAAYYAGPLAAQAGGFPMGAGQFRRAPLQSQAQMAAPYGQAASVSAAGYAYGRPQQYAGGVAIRPPPAAAGVAGFPSTQRAGAPSALAAAIMAARFGHSTPRPATTPAPAMYRR